MAEAAVDSTMVPGERGLVNNCMAPRRRARTSTSSTGRRLLRLLAALAPVAASRVGDAWLAARRARVAGRAGRWAAVLANYSAVQRAERARGADARYVVAFADN